MIGNSAISTTTINQNFPVQGTNNPSQGFRDNFAAIKLALKTAQNEISVLNSILERVIVNQRMDQYQWLTNDMQYHYIIRPTLIAPATTYRDVGSISGSYDFDFNAAGFQRVRLSSSVSVSITNFPKSEEVLSMRVWVQTTVPGLGMTLGSNFIFGSSASITGRTINFPAAGNYLLEFIGVDRGASIYAVLADGFR